MNSSAAPRSMMSQPVQQQRANVCGCDCPRGCANEPTGEQNLTNIPGRYGNWSCIRTSQKVERNATSQTPSSPRTFSGMYEQSTLTRTSDAYVNISEPETFSRIEQRYGDLRHLHLAANVIQKAYRNHVLNKSFLDLRNRRQLNTLNAGDEQEAQDADGTLTLTLHRISDWHNDGTLRPVERNDDSETVGNITSENQRCNDCSRTSDCAGGRVSASRLAQPAKTNETPGGGDRSPVWVRKPLAPRPDSRGALESDADGDADDVDVEEEGLSSRVVLRTAKWIENVRPAHGRERDRMAESVRTERERERERERRPLSFGAPSVGSRDCDCEECHMARRVAQLGIFFGCDARPSALPSNGNCNSFPAAVNPAMRRPEAERARKRLYRVALNLFNRQPEAGVQFLVAAGFVRDEPRAVARFLLVRRGLARSAIGEFLGVALRNAAVNEVLTAVANAYRFAEKPIDVALRRFQAAFQLTGEAQRIQHVVESFARAYTMQNQVQLAVWRTPNRADLVQLVALACVMLNTDLHSPSVRADRKMKPEEFVRNLSGLDDGADMDRASLLAIYERIRAEPLATSPDHVAHVRKLESLVIGLGGARPLSEQRRKSSAAALLGRQSSKTPETIAGAYRFEAAKLAVPYRRLVCYCRLFELTDSHVRKLVTAGTIRLTEHSRARSSSLQSVRADDDDDAAAAPIALRSLASQREHTTSVSLSDSQKREVFLFNDSVLVSKLNSKSKSKNKKDRAVTYTFRQLASLVNARVSLFECPQAPFGVCLILPANDMFCGKSGTDLFVMGASSAPARSSTVWYDDSTPNTNTTPAPAQDVTVLAFTAKSAADRQKFCEDLIESIVETRTLRRILARLAEGKSPGELARCYVEPPNECRLNDLTHAQRSLDDNGVGTRRGSEPMHLFNLPIRNVASNSNLSNASSAYGSHATGSVSYNSSSRPLSSACAPPTDGAVLRHTPILSVSSTSSSSLVSVGTLSTASNDGWQPHADASSNQSGASRHSAFDVPRLTPPSGSSVTPDKDQPHQPVHQHRAHAQAHSTASAPLNALSMQPEATCTRRNLQFVNTGRVTHAGGPVARRPNDDITFFAENRDYLTMPDAPASRIAK